MSMTHDSLVSAHSHRHTRQTTHGHASEQRAIPTVHLQYSRNERHAAVLASSSSYICGACGDPCCRGGRHVWGGGGAPHADLWNADHGGDGGGVVWWRCAARGGVLVGWRGWWGGGGGGGDGGVVVGWWLWWWWWVGVRRVVETELSCVISPSSSSAGPRLALALVAVVGA